MTPNRIAVILTALCGVGAAIAVPLGNLDTHSTASVLTGLAAIVAVAVKWLQGWQAHETRQADAEGPGDPDALPHVPTADPNAIAADQGDKGAP